MTNAKAVTIANESIQLEQGVQLAYYDSAPALDGIGAISSQVIVLLHGYCGSSAYWEQIVPLLEAHARVIAVDLRGHGASFEASEEVYTMDLFAQDIKQLIERLNLPKVCLLGHSLGGYVTLAAAEAYPELLGSIGLIHSTSLPDGEEAKANRDKAALAIQTNGVQEFVNGLVPKLFSPEHVTAMAEAVQLTKEIGYGTSARGASATALGMKGRPDRTSVLQQSPLPILLVAGARDGVIPPERTFIVDKPAVKKVTLELSGHMSMLEESERLAAAIVDFAAGRA
ncbi:alpha/beta fold hydrolase [Paenibacillus sp. GCM10023252]|uniref:alpha/beta fold hydrolase n=1 Tax=Paenibacillus sp. GCM10023252 TaxID=3252649 RepID=UPI003623351C